MIAFKSLLWSNIRRRAMDGFSVGYNILFPLLMILVLGLLTKGLFDGEVVTSYQYYGVVFVPFCLFMGIVTSAYGGKDDAYANTADRILLAPISVSSIVLSKVISQIIVFTGCSLMVFAVGAATWQVWRFSDLIPVTLLYLSIAFMIAAMGTTIGLSMKNFMQIKNILNVPMTVFAILAGCFYRFGTFHSGLQFIIDLSPLTWVNRSIFMMMFDHNAMMLYGVCGIFSGIGILFTLIAIIFFKKETYGDGELPGYEK